jgi:hypothetical protein
MDALIATFVDDLKQRVAVYNEDPDGSLFNDVSSTEADGKEGCNVRGAAVAG